jgi:pimeloyl-ACP methyl ester carboxylesterase
LLLRLFGPAGLARVVAGKLFPKPEHADLRRQIEQRLGQNDKDVYLRATRGLIGWTVLDRVSEIACPVLVLASDRDYTPVSAKEAYVAQLPNARLEVLKDSGHAAPAENPDQVLGAIERFLQRPDLAS